MVSPDLGNNTGIAIQSSQKGIVTVVLTNLAIGATVTLTTNGGTNWKMINSNLYVDDGDLPPEVRLCCVCVLLKKKIRLYILLGNGEYKRKDIPKSNLF